MKLNKTASVEELQVISRFESLRKILLSDQYADHRKKPLAYWALPTDRRLPLAFLGRTLEDLLRRAILRTVQHARDRTEKNVLFCDALGAGGQYRPLRTAHRPDRPFPSGSPAATATRRRATASTRPRSPKSLWSQWRASVVKHGLGDEKLGRFAPSLRNMTRVIWNTPLEFYTKYTLGEIRAMKTHGEKRIRAILEVFHSLHVLVANMGTQEDLVVRIVPRRIDRVEQWLGQVLQTPGVPEPGEIFDHFVSPLLEQVRTDATQQIASLAENRLGISAPDHQRAAGGPRHGPDPGPRLPTAQRDQRHHDRPLAAGPAPGLRTAGEAPERGPADGPAAQPGTVPRRRRVVLSGQSPRGRRTAGTRRVGGRGRSPARASSRTKRPNTSSARSDDSPRCRSRTLRPRRVPGLQCYGLAGSSAQISASATSHWTDWAISSRQAHSKGECGGVGPAGEVRRGQAQLGQPRAVGAAADDRQLRLAAQPLQGPLGVGHRPRLAAQPFGHVAVLRS